MQNNRYSESQHVAHMGFNVLTSRLSYRLNDKVTVRIRITFSVLFRHRSHPYTENASGPVSTSFRPKITQNPCGSFALALLSAFGRRRRSFPWLPLTWCNLEQKKPRWKTRADEPDELRLQSGGREMTPVLLAQAVFSSRQRNPTSFAFLQETFWAAWAGVWLEKEQERQFGTGHRLCVQTPHSPRGRHKPPTLVGREKPIQPSVGELQILRNHQLGIFFPLHRLFLMQQHRKEKTPV